MTAVLVTSMAGWKARTEAKARSNTSTGTAGSKSRPAVPTTSAMSTVL